MKNPVSRTATAILTPFASGLALAICLLAISCDNKPKDNCIQIHPEGNLEFAAEGGSLQVEISSCFDSWEAVYDTSWLKLSLSEEGSLDITAKPHIGENQTRQSTIQIHAPSVSNSQAQASIGVSQTSVSSLALDAHATANCYIINEAGTYSFNACVRGNGVSVPGIDLPASIAPDSALLLWQSEPDLIGSLSLEDGRIRFTASEKPGNALFAATDRDGNILWSWHIWHPGTQVEELTNKEGITFMNLNLGALTERPDDPACFGLLYQWGRKDPFPASPTITGTVSTLPAPVYDPNGQTVAIEASSYASTETNTLAYSVAHPTVCFSNMAQYSTNRDWLADGNGNDALWGHQGQKTMFDPSPAGWRVPNPEHFQTVTSNGGYCWTLSDFNVEDRTRDGLISLDDYENGWWFYLDSVQSVSSHFPAAARYDGSYAMLMGSVSGVWGSYWSNAPYETTMFNGGATAALSFSVKDQNGNEMVTVAPGGGAAKADAYAIRCVKE